MKEESLRKSKDKGYQTSFLSVIQSAKNHQGSVAQIQALHQSFFKDVVKVLNKKQPNFIAYEKSLKKHAENEQKAEELKTTFPSILNAQTVREKDYLLSKTTEE